jgi:hypothetical protein
LNGEPVLTAARIREEREILEDRKQRPDEEKDRRHEQHRQRRS